MFRFRNTMTAAILAFGLFGTAAGAQGGWVTIKNDTKKVIVLQETGGPLNRPIRGKCVKLQPGETYREFQLLSGTKNVVIYDAEAPNTPLAQEKVSWDKNDAAFAVQASGKAVTLAAATEKQKTTADEKTTSVKK